MISEIFINRVLKAVDKHGFFSRLDFEVYNTTDSDKSIIKIEFIPSPELFVEIVFDPGKNSSHIDESGAVYTVEHITVNVAPGYVLRTETTRLQSHLDVFKYVERWIDRVYEVFVGNPILRELRRHKGEFETFLNDQASLNDTFFTREEAEKINERLNTLEEDLVRAYNESESLKDSLEDEVESLRLEIDVLKESVNSLKKSRWMRLFSGRVYKWLKKSENRKLLKDTASLAKDLFLEE